MLTRVGSLHYHLDLEGMEAEVSVAVSILGPLIKEHFRFRLMLRT
jgi:hypothetical protein